MIKFHVSGITCGGCARSVTNAIKGVDQGATVNVDLAAKLVSIDSSASQNALADAIKGAGYGVAAA